MGKADDQAAMDHLLANSEKPIPEADDDDEEAVQSLESGEEAKVSHSHVPRSGYGADGSLSNVQNAARSFDHPLRRRSTPRNRDIRNSRNLQKR
jgi:hypothetical protein